MMKLYWIICFSSAVVSQALRDTADAVLQYESQRCECEHELPAGLDPAEKWLDAQERCESIAMEDDVEKGIFVAYVHMPERCKPKWCCKPMTDVAYHQLRSRTELTEYRNKVVSDLVYKSQGLLNRARPLFLEGQTFLEDSTVQSVSLLHLGLVKSIQKVLDTFMTCALSMDSVTLQCGSPFVVRMHIDRTSTQILGVMQKYHGTLNLIFLGARNPLHDLKSFGTSAVHLSRRALKLAASTLTSLTAQLPSQVSAMCLAGWQTLVQAQSFLWRQRMVIFASAVTVMNFAVIGDIIHTSMVTSSVSAGIVPVFESIMSQISTKIVCPMASNVFIVPFLAHWVIDNIILCETSQAIIEEMISPFVILLEGWRWIKAKLTFQKHEAFSRRITSFLKELNSNRWALVIYTFLYSHVAAFFHLANTLLCSGVQGLDKAAKVATGGAERVVEQTAAVASNWFDWSYLTVKEYMGGSVYLAQQVGEQQQQMNLGAGIPFFQEILAEFHRSLLNVMRVAGVAGQAGLAAVRSTNDLIEMMLVTDFTATVHGMVLGCFDTLDSLSQNSLGAPIKYVIGVGAASMIVTTSALASLVPDAAQKQLGPEFLYTFLRYEESQLETAIEDARAARINFLTPREEKDTTSERKRKRGEDIEEDEENDVWKQTKTKISDQKLALETFDQRFESHAISWLTDSDP